jgi:hypothetical protein
MNTSSLDVRPVRHYADTARFSAVNLLGYREETVFAAFPFIGERGGRAVFGANVASLHDPESCEQVTMSGTTSITRAYQAIIMFRDLFRMRIDESTGTSLTFDELIVALDSDDCGARYGFFGDLADDFCMTPNELIEALEVCRTVEMPVGELMAFGEVQTYRDLHAQLSSQE